MKKRVPNGITWPLPFGWRVSEQYRPPVQLASQIILYEQETMGNMHLDVPVFLLAELDRLEIGVYDVCWLCLTCNAACDFARQGDGEPYRVEVGDDAIILCEDGDGGFLLLFEKSRLSEGILAQFEQYRKKKEELSPSLISIRCK